MTRVRIWLGWLVISAACVSSGSTLPMLRPTRLPGTDGALHAVPDDAAARFTVLVFFSVNCDCQAAHDARLVELARRYRRQGVTFYAVDSEHGRSVATDAIEAHDRKYPYPILIDARAEVARELAAEYATYSVVLDRAGRVRYRGGVDSDLIHMTDGSTQYLQNALDDLLSGREPRQTTGNTLGCSLRID